MPTKAPQRKFHVTLQSQTSEHRRLVTISRTPCPTCENDPIRRGGWPLSETQTFPVCKGCDGRGDVPATKESAAAHLEALEEEYARFRLDDLATIGHYPALDLDSHAVVENTTAYFPKDTVLLDGRFIRGGKALTNPNPDPSMPGYTSQHRGWRSFHEQEKPYKVMRVGAMDLENAVTGGQYGTPMKNMLGGTRVWDWDTDTIKCALTTNAGYTVDIDTHDVFTAVTELSGTGYTAGGATLTASAPTYDTATDQVRLDAADTTWATSTITARRAVVYKSTGTASTSPLISFLDFGADVVTTAGTFQITWDATGIWILDIT